MIALPLVLSVSILFAFLAALSTPHLAGRWSPLDRLMLGYRLVEAVRSLRGQAGAASGRSAGS